MDRPFVWNTYYLLAHNRQAKAQLRRCGGGSASAVACSF